MRLIVSSELLQEIENALSTKVQHWDIESNYDANYHYVIDISPRWNNPSQKEIYILQKVYEHTKCVIDNDGSIANRCNTFQEFLDDYVAEQLGCPSGRV